MTFANVLLICLGAVAGCAVLVFAVETLVAFWFHEQEREQVPVMRGQAGMLDAQSRKVPFDKAA